MTKQLAGYTPTYVPFTVKVTKEELSSYIPKPGDVFFYKNGEIEITEVSDRINFQKNESGFWGKTSIGDAKGNSALNQFRNIILDILKYSPVSFGQKVKEKKPEISELPKNDAKLTLFQTYPKLKPILGLSLVLVLTYGLYKFSKSRSDL